MGNQPSTLSVKHNETIILDQKINRIITLSDIHSDIHAFIICLRDCAKVIRKKHLETIDIYSLDKDTEDLLELNLNIREEQYIDDLNFEWIGGNTHIVICGDIIDGARSNETTTRTGIPGTRCFPEHCTNNEYEQVEIKLLKLINNLNNQAIQQGGRIIKVLGNHEFMNLANNVSVRNYIQPHTLTLGDKYYINSSTKKKYSRINYFNAGNPGSELLLEGGAYLLLIINNNLFVHGQIDPTKTLQDYIDYNKLINDPINNNSNPDNIWSRLQLDLTIWGRNYDKGSAIYENNQKRLNEQYSGIISTPPYNHQQKCESVRDQLNIFIKDIKTIYPKYNYTLDDIRVIVGHCPQFMNDSPYSLSVSNSTFETITKDGNREILNGRIKTGIKNSPDMLFGIGMECDKITNDREPQLTIDDHQRYIYKVDVGSTRAFDNPYPYTYNQIDYTPRTMDDFINEFGSRVPQVLEIQGMNDIRILRSTINNTRIHQPRETIENHINNPDIVNIGGLDLGITDIPSVYRPDEHRKYLLSNSSSEKDLYLKYKKKYLKLQSQLANKEQKNLI